MHDYTNRYIKLSVLAMDSLVLAPIGTDERTVTKLLVQVMSGPVLLGFCSECFYDATPLELISNSTRARRISYLPNVKPRH